MKYTFEQLPDAILTLNEKIDRIENMLLKQYGKIQEKSEGILTVNDAANFLSLTPQTIYGLVSTRKIPHMKKGKRLYFSQSELTDWIKEGRQKTMLEIHDEASDYLVTRKKGGK